MTILHAPVVWAAAIYQQDYESLSKESRIECNVWLIESGLLFLDCKRVGKPVVMEFNGTQRLCAVYTFK